MGKLVITRVKDRLLITLFEGKRPYLMETASLPGQEGILGNIYLAKVKDVVPGMNGAFLSIDGKQMAYLSFGEAKNVLTVNRDWTEEDSLHQEDEIVVQITGEALKTKQPSASLDLTLTGQYCVCSYWGHGISYSRKLSAGKKQQIRDAFGQSEIDGRKEYQFTIRTNAENLQDFTPLFEEMKSFIATFRTLNATYQHRTCYTCFYRKETEVISRIKNIPLSTYEEIVTDDADVYEILKNTLTGKAVRLYEDELLSLSRLYSLKTHLKEVLGRKVWLPCGGYLIIEPTEAMVVIDVNSGKTQSKGKKSREYYLKVNLEAAREVARQLRLRNYSGMIMVDFINMDTKEDNQTLLKTLDSYLKEDKSGTRLVDMTALGIVEITRKKLSRPLSDFFSQNDFI
ncbi:MAG: ribonuclease E/G [Lachnospiraceae bacterium]|nr:ribonuclease E/G [Lachnospiraceae bacterium]